jgi:nucleotide-binding universal stress UspA family protein
MKLMLVIPHGKFFQEAVSYTRLIAAQSGASLLALYVAYNEEDRAAGEAALAQLKELLPGVELVAQLDIGTPIDEILARIVPQESIDLVIIGAAKDPGFLRRAPEALVHRTIDKSPVPVLVVREAKKKLEHVLICTGGLDKGQNVIESGAQMAENVGAKATLLYVTGNVPSMYTGLGQMEVTLKQLLDTDTPLARNLRKAAAILEKHDVDGQLEMRQGVPDEAILSASQEGNYDLIVLGASRAGKNLRNWLLGNVTRQVMEKTTCPILIVHREDVLPSSA